MRRCLLFFTPAWIAQLRQDAQVAEKSISYDIKIYDPMAWRRKRFTFSEELWDPNRMGSILRKRLCLGEEDKEYTIVGEAFPFPDREDSPVINEPSFPCKLLWDHTSATEKIMIQLSDAFPPILWITVKPLLSALKKVFGEFIEADTQHMKKYLPYYEGLQNDLETRTKEKLGDTLSHARMKDQFIEDMRQRDPRSLGLDYSEEFNVFLGTAMHFRNIEDKLMKKNPFVFGWPLLIGEGNHHLEQTPLRMSAFRSIYSKSLLYFYTRLDLQIDHRQVKLDVRDEDEIVLDIPVFATVNFPSNSRLCGGSMLVARYNQVMGTSYPLNTPVDVLAAFACETTQKSTVDLLDELKFLQKASEKAPDVERVVRLSQDMMSTNRIVGQLAFTIVYLALMGHEKFVDDVFELYKRHPSDMVRVACAKGAHIRERPDLIQCMIDLEPDGRAKRMLESTLSMCPQTINNETN